MLILHGMTSILLGWSLSYLGIYYRRFDYERYYVVVIMLYMLLVAFWFGGNIIVGIMGLLFSILTIIFTEVRKIGEGYLVDDLTYSKKGNIIRIS